MLSDRFELNPNLRNQVLTTVQSNNNLPIIGVLNILFSQINSVNNDPLRVEKLNVIRLYLIKSFRGRCHAIGKPVRGQRTWSNAWNSYNLNKIVRSFIAETKRLSKSTAAAEKINYKLIKKKYATRKKASTKKTVTKLTASLWY